LPLDRIIDFGRQTLRMASSEIDERTLIVSGHVYLLHHLVIDFRPGLRRNNTLAFPHSPIVRPPARGVLRRKFRLPLYHDEKISSRSVTIQPNKA